MFDVFTQHRAFHTAFAAAVGYFATWGQQLYVCLHGSYLCVPDVHAFVKGAAGQMPTIGAESHAVDWLLVFSQRVDTDASLHVPETNRGVKRCTVGAEDQDRVTEEVLLRTL